MIRLSVPKTQKEMIDIITKYSGKLFIVFSNGHLSELFYFIKTNKFQGIFLDLDDYDLDKCEWPEKQPYVYNEFNGEIIIKDCSIFNVLIGE